MKKIFYFGLIGLLLFEIANVYFIMPMPGSQRMNSIDLAYFLYRWRWIFRVLFLIILLYGFFKSSWKRLWTPFLSITIAVSGIYFLNFQMAADHMFYKTKNLLMAEINKNKVDTQRLVIGVESKGIAKAYPIQYLGYHHQVSDSIGEKPIIVTYCTVCRTGRVYEPKVNGKYETFRLVGMDHFNAMFEDASTKSWWRQATGEAIAGKLKGEKLPEVLSTQTSLGEWLRLYPKTLVMQADPDFASSYDSTYKYENGKSKSKLIGTDSLSWRNKSWVIGVKSGNKAKAYDWNQLKEQRIIRDKIDQVPVALILLPDIKVFLLLKHLL
ncbi:MAG: DUF3179 domain-containing protein [Bacteroidota bacterium]|nr:DUF3179 domain-containing protein [Bacteroidota bacterium]